ncbi:MAG: anti-sigma factor antagonist [Bacteroidales bacterium]|nr:anti-sigma factor antagonist [Lentimicrobiaceae bacterium]MDD5693974.1 anti-sigma factor antagonist [Bacteroidales bacterium]
MLSIQIQQQEKSSVITLEGQFNALGAVDFDAQVANISPGETNLILDFSRVTFLSSAGVRSILKLGQSVRSAKGILYISGLSDTVNQVFDISGLSRYLNITRDLDEVYALIERAHQPGLHFETQHCTWKLRPSGTGNNQAVIWNKKYCSGSWGVSDDQPILANSREFTFAIGEGSFIQGTKPDESQRGHFLTIGQFTGLCPHDATLPFDYMIADPKEGYGIYLWDAISMVGEPNIEIIMKAVKEVALSRLVQDLFTIMTKVNRQVPEVMGMVLEGKIIEKGKAPDRVVNENNFLAGVVAVHHKALADRNDPEILAHFSSGYGNPAGDDAEYQAIAAFMGPGGETDSFIDSSRFPELNPEHLQRLAAVEDLSGITGARIRLYIPRDFIPASSQRLHIEKKDDFWFPDAWEFIARDLYQGSSKLILTPIHGGFSASTFFADSFDRQGRRQLPSVLKIAGRKIIDREEANYNEYVKKYILNNSTSIFGTSVFQEWKGLCISFVGITGPDSNIQWLTKHYKTRPAEELLPLFDKIFTQILKPWYGQPRLEVIFPYRDHYPCLDFFPHICSDAEEELGISSKDKFVFLRELQREIINPYWFLDNIFEQRRDYKKLWYRCITHQDLNMQNILLDEIENVYIIDFSETGPGNAVADFARLEPILKIEMSRMASEKDLIELIDFEKGLLEPDSLDQMPLFHYQGDDPNVRKAYQVICQLRHYADVVTLFEKDIEPYLLAVLEWTYPVVSYKGVDKLRKRYSACSAALICEKILAMT